MVIYGEYLFLENFVTGWILLMLTAKLAGSRTVFVRTVAAGVLCGAGGFTVFLPVSGVAAIMVRVVIAFIVSAVCFGMEGLLKKTIIFVSLTFLSGGAAMAFLLWQQIPAVSGNGALYMQPLTYFRLVLWGSCGFGITWIFMNILKERRMTDITRGEVCLYINGRSYVFEALADSGNNLKEPLTGRPVSLIDRAGAAKLGQDIPAERTVLVPYRAVGTENGLLTGFRADKLEFCGKTCKEAVIAFYEGDFGDFEVLLSREVLNGEIT